MPSHLVCLLSSCDAWLGLKAFDHEENQSAVGADIVQFINAVDLYARRYDHKAKEKAIPAGNIEY